MKKRTLKTIELDEVDSTNTYLKALAQKGEKEGCVVTARRQSAGRGRRGKNFFSPPDTGLYMSILVRPCLSVSQSHFMTAMTAVAVSRAIEAVTDKRCGIKWVNDIYVSDKKVSGILCEGSFDYENDSTNYIVVGIGVNLMSPENGFPNDIKDIAASLDTLQKKALTDRITEEFFLLYDRLPSLEFFEEYKRRSSLISKRVKVLTEPSFFAKVIDIDSECRLVVRCDSGEIKALSSGEISTKIIDFGG